MSILLVTMDSLAACLRCKGAANLRGVSVNFAINPNLKDRVSSEACRLEKQKDEEELVKLLERIEETARSEEAFRTAGVLDEWSIDSDGHWSPRSP